MDFKQLKIFLAVADELHFGRAAERLHMAQPPVSRSIVQLERSLGTKLFERSTRRVELTPIGRQFVTAARAVMAAVDDATALVAAARSGETGEVDLVFAGASTHVLLGSLSRELKRSHPGIVATMHSQVLAQQALGRVLGGEADIGLGRWDLLPPEVESLIVARERLVLAVPATHRLASASTVSFDELQGEPFIELADTRSVLHDRLLRLAHAAGFEPRTVQQAPDTSTALAFVAADIGSALTLDSVQRNTRDEHVAFLEVEGEVPPVELRMAWLRRNTNPALRHALRAAEAAWPSLEVPGRADADESAGSSQ